MVCEVHWMRGQQKSERSDVNRHGVMAPTAKIFKYSGELLYIMFRVSQAKKQVLEKLAEQDWTPTDLAAELGKSPETVYNHLDDLAELDILTTRQVPAKTRPKTGYSIGPGFVQYIAVAPGIVQEGAFALDEHKGPLLRIWMLPQESFHPFLQEYWWRLTHSPDIDLREDIKAVGVYGSVARGDADAGSDIDVLIVAEGSDAAATVIDRVGSVRIEPDAGGRIVLAEVFTLEEFRNSWVHGSQFLHEVLPDVHPIYDPDRVFDHPNDMVEDRAALEAVTDEQ